MKIIKTLSNTEKTLALVVGVLSLVLIFGGAGEKLGVDTKIFADEASESSEQSSDGDEKSSSDDEKSTKSEESMSKDSDEMSTPSTQEVSTESVDEVSTVSVQEVSTMSEEGEESVSDDSDEMSSSEDELSSLESDEVSTVSTVSVKSVSSGDNVRDFEDAILFGDNTAVIFEDGRLFFLVPVKIEKTLLLDESGNVLDVQQTLLNRLLSLFSF